MPLNGFKTQLPSEVIDKAKKGELESLEQVYHAYADASYTLAFRICQCQSLAQDITQESFIKVINKVKEYDGKGYFSGWIRTIVIRETINRIKSVNRLTLVTDSEVNELQSHDIFDYDWLSACLDLDTLLQRLPITMRAVLLLHEVEGLTHKEIAEIYGKSESFSKTTLNRAYKSLKATVNEREQIHAFK